MSGSVFQQGFYGGDKCRISRLASAVQLALHRKIIESAENHADSIYKGAIDCTEQLVTNPPAQSTNGSSYI